MQLSINGEILPKHMWITYEEDLEYRYLTPYIKEVEKEMQEKRDYGEILEYWQPPRLGWSQRKFDRFFFPFLTFWVFMHFMKFVDLKLKKYLSIVDKEFTCTARFASLTSSSYTFKWHGKSWYLCIRFFIWINIPDSAFLDFLGDSLGRIV